MSDDFPSEVRYLAARLHATTPIHTGEWHAKDTSGNKLLATHEIVNYRLDMLMPTTVHTAQSVIGPNLPWAEDHFLERVSGVPYNPPPSSAWWPYGSQRAQHEDGTFSHTYPERFWPKHAGHPTCPVLYEKDPHSDAFHCDYAQFARGIRYEYGDLSDVVDLLVRSPLTRQAVLPVWFPEDTGNVPNVRVPCSLTYHFMIRAGHLDVWYTMRSCDFIRHFRDDVYHAVRLAQWMVAEVNQRTNEEYGVDDLGGFDLGVLHMTVSSLHAMVGDEYTLMRMAV